MENQNERYSRQILLPEIGAEGQKRLAAAAALIVGLGGLGCPVSLYLAGAGVGRIGLADHDCVSLHNLQRQTLYSEASVGRSKTEAAGERLAALSSATRFDLYPDGLTATTASEIIARYDLVIDCTDNFATRFLINDTCRMLHKPWIMGAIAEFGGQVSVMNHNGGPDLSALYDDMQRAELVSRPHAAGGVIGATPGVTGAIQACEAIKILAGMQPALSGRLFTIDLLTMQTQIFEL